MKKLVIGVSLGLCTVLTSSLAHAQDELKVKADAGLGYSSNVYHAPSSSYFDYAAVVPAIVNPNVQSGLFVPMSLKVKYLSDSDIKMQYLFDGRYYLGSGLANANTYNNKVKLGKDNDVEDGTLYLGGFLGTHVQTYFDKDTGDNKLSLTSGTDISARYNYQDFGLEAKFKTKISDVLYVIEGKYASLNYDTVVVSDLDNTQLHLGGYARLAIAGDMKVKAGYKFSTLDYSKRKARDVAAALVATTRSYTYHQFTGQLLWKADDMLKVFLDAGYTKRVDNFVGYNDYTKMLMKVRALYALNDDISVRGKLLYSNTDYANAFAFEDPTLAKKTSSTLLASVSGKYKTSLLRTSALWAKFDYKDVSSNDLRYDYKLAEISAGGDWKF